MQSNQTWSSARRSGSRWLLAIVALGLLGVWLLLTAAEGYSPLHSWLHGGIAPQDDDCAVMLLATGKVDLSQAAVTVVPVLLAAIVLIEFVILPFVTKLPLPPGRAPPFFSLAR